MGGAVLSYSGESANMPEQVSVDERASERTNANPIELSRIGQNCKCNALVLASDGDGCESRHH